MPRAPILIPRPPVMPPADGIRQLSVRPAPVRGGVSTPRPRPAATPRQQARLCRSPAVVASALRAVDARRPDVFRHFRAAVMPETTPRQPCCCAPPRAFLHAFDAAAVRFFTPPLPPPFWRIHAYRRPFIEHVYSLHADDNALPVMEDSVARASSRRTPAARVCRTVLTRPRARGAPREILPPRAAPRTARRRRLLPRSRATAGAPPEA